MATINLGRIKPVFRGAYAGGTAYVVDDIVTHGNESFICIQAGTGTATSTASYWTKLAAKGTDGTDVGTTLTTHGDIRYRDGSGLQRLAAGTSGQVLQTVKYNNGEETTCTSQSFNTSDVVGGATITPISATSDILLFGQVTVPTNSTAAYVYVDFYKNASDFTETANLSGQTGGLAVNGHSLWLHCFITWLDVCSENSTSEKTYKISCRNNSPGGTSYLGWGSASQNIIIMQEIAR